MSVGSTLRPYRILARGDRDEALANLTRVANERRGTLAFAFLTHAFDKYRSDPAFVDLLVSSGFEFNRHGANVR